MTATLQRWEHAEGRGWIAIMQSDDPAADLASIHANKSLTIEGHNYEVIGFQCNGGEKVGSPFGVIIRGEPIRPAAGRFS